MLITIPGNPITRKIRCTRHGGMYIATAKQEADIATQIRIQANRLRFIRDDSKQLQVRIKYYMRKNKPGRPPDPDRLQVLYRDAIKRAGLVKDDAEKYIHIYFDPEDYIRENNIDPRTEIIIEEEDNKIEWPEYSEPEHGCALVHLRQNIKE